MTGSPPQFVRTCTWSVLWTTARTWSTRRSTALKRVTSVLDLTDVLPARYGAVMTCADTSICVPKPLFSFTNLLLPKILIEYRMEIIINVKIIVPELIFVWKFSVQISPSHLYSSLVRYQRQYVVLKDQILSLVCLYTVNINRWFKIKNGKIASFRPLTAHIYRPKTLSNMFLYVMLDEILGISLTQALKISCKLYQRLMFHSV